MVTRSKLVEQLDLLGVEFNENAPKQELEALLIKEKQQAGIEGDVPMNAMPPVSNEARRKAEAPSGMRKVQGVTREDLIQFEKEGILYGYDPDMQTAIVKNK